MEAKIKCGCRTISLGDHRQNLTGCSQY